MKKVTLYLKFLRLASILKCWVEARIGPESQQSPPVHIDKANTLKPSPEIKMSANSTNIIFSDIDGTLIHYPKHIHDLSEPGNKILYLPPSTTGMKGIISSKTLKLCQEIRRHGNSKLVLVSGMRTETLIKRLPFLPKADAYASEAGGRIFYPLTNLQNYNGGIIEPQEFDGALDTDLEPFSIEEDLEWREIMSRIDAAGSDGYAGDAMDLFLHKSQYIDTIPIEERTGLLWDFARELQEQGFILDYKGYACCFRVNMKQQEQVPEKDFLSLSDLDVTANGLGSSVNLGCIDFYPIQSGKKNW